MRRATFFLLALIAAFGFWLRYRIVLDTGGADGYEAWAQDGFFGGIVFENLFNARKLCEHDFQALAHAHPLGYPLLICLASPFLPRPELFRYLQIALDSAASCLPFFIMRRIGTGTAAGFFASFMYAWSPWWVFGAGMLLGESLLPALFLVVIYLLLVVRDRPEVWAWFGVGLLAGYGPLLRNEMSGALVLLAAWAWASASSARLARTAVVVAGFAIPSIGVAVFNFLTSGYLGISSNIFWDVAFFGLGEQSNKYGYFIDDPTAGDLLKSLGLQWQTPEATAYWRARYLDAWIQHPTYVLFTIWERIKNIATGIEGRRPMRFEGMVSFGPPLLAVAIAVLSIQKRFAVAGLMAAPLLYAIVTIGPLHWEHRYTRYAMLSYIFASAFIIDHLIRYRRQMTS